MSDEKKVGGLNLPPIETRFKKGQSGNPGGLAKGTRNKLNGDFLKALSKDFDEHGVKAIENARIEDPVGYVKIVASLLPKQIEQHSPLDDVSDTELTAAIALLKSKLSDSAEQPSTPTH